MLLLVVEGSVQLPSQYGAIVVDPQPHATMRVSVRTSVVLIMNHLSELDLPTVTAALERFAADPVDHWIGPLS